VEIVQLVHPDHSYRILDEMVDHVKGILQKLELHFRVIRLCGGDMGFTSALTYDFEAWSAAQERWLEVSSTSNFETFQANRLKCRFKNSEGKTQLVHTLNGSALALPRIVASLLENGGYSHSCRIGALHRFRYDSKINSLESIPAFCEWFTCATVNRRNYMKQYPSEAAPMRSLGCVFDFLIIPHH
jgi:seryl-tRNA synthetase